MTINERIKQIRKEFNWNQKQLAKQLGVTQSGISYMEQPGSNVADSTIKTICTICSLNENWLRFGQGPMYIQPNTFSLDEFVKKHKATSVELEILKAYFELDPEIRKAAINHFKQRFSIIDEDQNKTSAENVPNTPEELERQFPPVSSDIDNSEVS